MTERSAIAIVLLGALSVAVGVGTLVGAVVGAVAGLGAALALAGALLVAAGLLFVDLESGDDA